MQENAAHRLAQAALETWSHIHQAVTEGKAADVVLQTWWRDHRLYGSRDRRFMAEAIFSTFRWKGWLEPLNLTPAAALGIAYLLDAKDPHLSADILLKQGNGPSSLAPAGSLTVNEKANWLAAAFPANAPPDRLDLVPGWFRSVIAEDPIPSFIASIQTRPPTWLRARRGEVEAACALLTADGVKHRRDSRLPEAIALEQSPSSETLHKLAKRGCCVQDITSQAVGLVCDAAPGSRWWDLCAGAGGKTMHLSDQVGPRGHILATDVRESALIELERRAQLANLRNLNLRLLRPDQPPPGGPFDGILIDAPCSGTGTWGRNPDARWRTSLETVTRMAATQRTLLQRALPHLKPGGILVFSTCSVATPEGQPVVDNFLQANQSCRSSEFSTPLLTYPLPGATTIWPDTGPGIGMFVARIIK